MFAFKLGLILVIVPLVIGFLVGKQNEKADEKTRYFFNYHGKRYEKGTELIIKKLDAKEQVVAVFKFYDMEYDYYCLEPVVGKEKDILSYSENEFFANLVSVNEKKYDLNELHVNKAKYNNLMYKCPMCGSSKVKEIGMLEKTVSIGVAGLASNKIDKTYQCDNCGYKW